MVLKALTEWFDGEKSDDFKRRRYMEHHYGEIIPAGEVVPAHDIAIKNHRERRPEFKRTYSTTITRGIVLSVTIRNGLGGIYESGEMTQPGGKSIRFDPRNIADKIIDPVVLPEATAAAKVILSLDAGYRKAIPSEFTDEGGVRWRRVTG